MLFCVTLVIVGYITLLKNAFITMNYMVLSVIFYLIL